MSLWVADLGLTGVRGVSLLVMGVASSSRSLRDCVSRPLSVVLSVCSSAEFSDALISCVAMTFSGMNNVRLIDVSDAISCICGSNPFNMAWDLSKSQVDNEGDFFAISSREANNNSSLGSL